MNSNSILLPKVNTTHPNDNFAITIAELSLQEVYNLADDPSNGAIVLMSGMVRNNTEGKKVISLEYQAYKEMAISVFNSIAHQIRQQWNDVNRVVIHHRTGSLNIGEISVLVAIGCPHRAEAYEACRYAIDTLKHNAPIWKKEYFQTEDGTITHQWVNCC